jgi:hypothetical protein
MAQEIWFAFGLDPLNERFVVLGVAETEAAAKEALRRADEDVVYRRAFNVLSGTLRQDMSAWLQSCGVPATEREQIFKEFARQTKALLDTPKKRRKGRRPGGQTATGW